MKFFLIKRDQTGAVPFSPTRLVCRHLMLLEIGVQDSLERRSGDHPLGLRLKLYGMIEKRRRRAPRAVTKDLLLRWFFLPSHPLRPSCVTDLNLRVSAGSPTFGIEASGFSFCSQPIPQSSGRLASKAGTYLGVALPHLHLWSTLRQLIRGKGDPCPVRELRPLGTDSYAER